MKILVLTMLLCLNVAFADDKKEIPRSEDATLLEKIKNHVNEIEGNVTELSRGLHQEGQDVEKKTKKAVQDSLENIANELHVLEKKIRKMTKKTDSEKSK